MGLRRKLYQMAENMNEAKLSIRRSVSLVRGDVERDARNAYTILFLMRKRVTIPVVYFAFREIWNGG